MLQGLSVIRYKLYQNYKPAHLQPLRQAGPFWLGIAPLVPNFGYAHRPRYIPEKHLSWKQSFQMIMLWEVASCTMVLSRWESRIYTSEPATSTEHPLPSKLQ